jgi:tRNA-2-methylthio-N6-dimethylallyladenosine synthase
VAARQLPQPPRDARPPRSRRDPHHRPRRPQTEETFETEFTARTNPHRGYITIIEGCDKFCAYCVVPYTRGKERSRTSQSVLAEARRMADSGYTEIQLLGQNVNSYRDPEGKMTFAELLAAVGEFPASAASASPPRIRATSPATSSTPSTPSPRSATTSICPCRAARPRPQGAMQREYTRDWYLERIAWIKAAKREISITTDIIVGFPGETEADFGETITLLDEVGYDAVFAFKYSPRPNTPSRRCGWIVRFLWRKWC